VNARLSDLDVHGRPTLPVDDAASIAGVSRGLGYQAAQDGTWPVLRVGRRLLVQTVPFLVAQLGLSEDAAVVLVWGAGREEAPID
jgi:hypothetical protein